MDGQKQEDSEESKVIRMGGAHRLLICLILPTAITSLRKQPAGTPYMLLYDCNLTYVSTYPEIHPFISYPVAILVGLCMNIEQQKLKCIVLTAI